MGFWDCCAHCRCSPSRFTAIKLEINRVERAVVFSLSTLKEAKHPAGNCKNSFCACEQDRVVDNIENNR